MNRDATFEAAKAFMMKEHRLYFQRIENLVVGMNFVKSAADFAIAQITAERERIVAALEAEIGKADPGRYDGWNDALNRGIDIVNGTP